jgi:hypothetical protein
MTNLCMVKDCDEEAKFLIESGIYICDRHVGPKRWVCKFCGVSIISPQDTRPAQKSAKHKIDCPRAKKE